MVIVGITGQSGSGKGYLSAEFAKLGYVHADADKIYHTLLKTNCALKQELVNEFGSDVEKDGEIDRKALGKKVFGKKNSRRLQKLNKISHKHVCREYIKMIIKAKENGDKGFVIDAPLLIEARLHKICDICICVACSEEIRIERIMNRDKIDYSAAKLRIDSQKPLEFYSSQCELIFICDGSESAADFASKIDKTLTGGTDE